MSAFICNNYHISILAVEMKHQGIDFSINGAKLLVEQIAEELYKTNLESVNYRYEENTPANFIFDRKLLVSSYKLYSPLQIIKAALCYEYQACEHPDYKNSLANMFIKLLIRRMIQRMPGYKDAEYELEKPQGEPMHASAPELK